ncbi:ABC transporter permease [Clostridium estertheticum]|uniref:ABC transporter permease n=1 Tax=Clostridium estertheticum TaxID=238834 RepID=UPI0013E903D0|nr:ABC transporter permease [Clostridium estertheticum]MBZ9688603.1 ABC transporter permease [Clostridium estertheticum]
MLKLMKLEIKKYKITGYIRNVIIANLIISGILFMVIFASKADMEVPFSTYNDAVLLTGTIVRATFSIFAAVIISRIIIGEYKSKTINIMFLYPINRKKIMIAKLAIVVLFAFTSMVISSIFANFSLYILNIFVNFIQVPLTQEILVKSLINIVVYSAAFSFVSLIPVYVGMRRKSGSATIVTSVILVSLLNSGNSKNSLGTIIIIPLILAIIGAVAAYLSIKDVEKVDVLNF